MTPHRLRLRAFIRFKQIKPAEKTKAPEPPKEPMTVEEIKAAFTECGIEIPEGARKADLEKLYAESDPNKEPAG